MRETTSVLLQDQRQTVEVVDLSFGQIGSIVFGRLLSVARQITYVLFERHRLVMISTDGGDTLRPNEIDTRGWIRSIADNITEAVYCVDISTGDRAEHRSQSLQVRMDVGNNRELHLSGRWGHALSAPGLTIVEG